PPAAAAHPQTRRTRRAERPAVPAAPGAGPAPPRPRSHFRLLRRDYASPVRPAAPRPQRHRPADVPPRPDPRGGPAQTTDTDAARPAYSGHPRGGLRGFPCRGTQDDPQPDAGGRILMDLAKLSWLLEKLLERTPGTRHALVLSRDGLK